MTAFLASMLCNFLKASIGYEVAFRNQTYRG